MAVISAQVIAGFLLVCLLVIIQSQHRRAHRAEAIVLLCVNTVSQSASWDVASLVEHTVDLYRQGYATRIYVAGVDDAVLVGARGGLVDHGIPETVVQVAQSGTTRYTAIVHVVSLLYQHGVASAVLVDEPSAMLENLKMARDLGLAAYASPPPGPPPDIGQVIRAAYAYWGYVLGKNQVGEHPR